MNIAPIIARLHFLPDWLLVKLYPPFFVMGVRIDAVSPDYHHLEVSIPLRWWARNLNGTMFGGFMCAVTDPLAALMCHRILPGIEIWTKTHSVEFLKPARTRLTVTLDIRPEEIRAIQDELARSGKATHTFRFQMIDPRRRVIAHVANTLYFRKPRLKPGEGLRNPRSPRASRP